MKRGFEPASCFYTQNEERVRGKADLDPNVGPPPDLVIEMDITSPSRFPIHARSAVPEVWRYDGEGVLVYGLREAGSVELSQGVALPILTSAVITGFARDGLTTRRRAWMREVREWARNRAGSSD